MYTFWFMLLFNICTLNGQKMKKTLFLRKKWPFLSRYSHEIAHLANFFTLKTPIYFWNEHRLLFLFFSPTALLGPHNWFKNVYFFNIFQIMPLLKFLFYKATFFWTLVKKVCKLNLYNYIQMLHFEVCTLNI